MDIQSPLDIHPCLICQQDIFTYDIFCEICQVVSPASSDTDD